jgi:hypothetical protein
MHTKDEQVLNWARFTNTFSSLYKCSVSLHELVERARREFNVALFGSVRILFRE